MKLHEITEQSKKRAEEIIKREGEGILVPVYSVLITDENGRVRRIIHDHLNGVRHMYTDDLNNK